MKVLEDILGRNHKNSISFQSNREKTSRNRRYSKEKKISNKEAKKNQTSYLLEDEPIENKSSSEFGVHKHFLCCQRKLVTSSLEVTKHSDDSRARHQIRFCLGYGSLPTTQLSCKIRIRATVKIPCVLNYTPLFFL